MEFEYQPSENALTSPLQKGLYPLDVTKRILNRRMVFGEQRALTVEQYLEGGKCCFRVASLRPYPSEAAQQAKCARIGLAVTCFGLLLQSDVDGLGLCKASQTGQRAGQVGTTNQGSLVILAEDSLKLFQ